jgi:uncharacterized Zn-binding protein involved in type VI secretion
MLCLQEDIEELIGKYPDPRAGEAGAAAFRMDRESRAALPRFALVADNKDPLGLGRIRVAGDMLSPGALTDWIPIARPFRGDPGSGAWILPDIGAQVLVVFLRQDPGMPIAIGCVFDRRNKPPEVVTRKAGDCVVWQTRSHRIEITDEEGKESLVISTKGGKLRYEAAKAGGVKIVNELGDIGISCRNLRIAAEAGVGFRAEEDFSFRGGGDVSLKSTQGMVFDGGEKAVMKGKNVKLQGSRGVCACGKQIAKSGDSVMGFDVHNAEAPSVSGTVTVPLPHLFIGKLSSGLSANVKIGGAGAAVVGSVCKHDDSMHCLLSGMVRFTKNPKMEGSVSGGTAASVKINGKEAAVVGSTVSTCNDMGQKDNSMILAAGAAFPMPAIINPANTAEYNRQRAEQEKRKPEFLSACWERACAGEGEELRLSVRTQDIGEGNPVTFLVWKEGQDPASHIPLAQIQAAVRDSGAQALWSWRWEAEEPPPEKDPEFFFTVHSAWCASVRSGTAAIKLGRPGLENPRWMDMDGKAADRGRVGEALKLSVSCTADMEEGAGVIFRIYPRGADTRRDRPVAQADAANRGGTAEAEWIYRYVHDEENPLTEKPEFFFVAGGRRCGEAHSGAVEISQNLELAVITGKEYPAGETEYTVFLPGGDTLEGKTGDDGIIREEGLVPGIYEVVIKGEEGGNE